MKLSEPLGLSSGLMLKNRIAKAAMTEQLCRSGTPHGAYVRLYRTFADGGVGLIITGNMMVDGEQKEHPRNVVVDSQAALPEFKQVADACRGKAPIIAQLNHPGRQALATKGAPVAPSPIGVQGLGPFFKQPRELKEDEILEIVEKFARAARFLESAGFQGVQVHAAHGYLASQFLSPLTNKRSDQWGGSLENRARFLLAVVDAIHRVTKPTFSVMVKLNSADFQRGGFDADDALAVMSMLEAHNVDLLEISGGSYEAPAMTGMVRESTRQREAYFLEFAERARKATRLPLMVTGGFRTPQAMEDALQSGAVDVIGLARTMAIDPSLPAKILNGDMRPARTGRDTIGIRFFDAALAAQFYVENLHRIAANKEPDPELSRVWVIAHTMWMAQGL